jgi:predicted ATPase
MISLIEVHNYRCLKYIRQHLGGFSVLVGPNASGKTTFLDAIAFLGDMLERGLGDAISRRTPDIRDLTWMRECDRFEIAIEAEIPEEKRDLLSDAGFSHCRYEIAIGLTPDTGENAVLDEKVFFRKGAQSRGNGQHNVQRTLFPMAPVAPRTIMTKRGASGTCTIVHRTHCGKAYFRGETGSKWRHWFRLSATTPALTFLPDETQFPVSTWLRDLLKENVHTLSLNSQFIRRPSPPGKPRRFQPDGSNLPWVIKSLEDERPDLLNEWVGHLRTALPDIKGVRTIERPEDRHRYLVVQYGQGVEVPSWFVSDGTLRLMALTLLAYIPGLSGIYLIEEPENGLHPRAIETMFQSLSSVYDAQVLVATHSPLIVGIADPKQILCFGKTEDGSADMVRGDKHPKLRDWRGEVNLGELFAAGFLG